MSDPNLKHRVTHLQIHTKSTLNFINIYAPSVDGKKKPFYRSLNKYLANFNNNYTILMGDFNYVSHRSDRLNKLRACDSYIRNIFKPKEFSLEDSYKHFHKEPDFTRQNSRIDRIYVSDFLINKIDSVKHLNYIADHRPVFISIYIENTALWGNFYWKLSNSLLDDNVYRNKIIDFIKEMEDEKGKENSLSIWENFKNKIKKISIKFGKTKAYQRKIMLEICKETKNRIFDGEIIEKIEARSSKLPVNSPVVRHGILLVAERINKNHIMAQAQMGYITTNNETTTTTSNYNNSQYEEVEYPRRDTITIQPSGTISIDQIFTYFVNLNILDQVACILKIPDQRPLYEITVKQGHDALLFQREAFKQPFIIGGHEITLVQTRKLKDIIKLPTIRVQIYEAPYELQDRHILQKLAPYGIMAMNELFSHKYRGTDIYNGVRTATYTKITKPIPTVLFVRGIRIKTKYETQDRTPICGICRTKGHFQDDCPRLREVRNLEELIETGKTLPVQDIRPILKEQEEEGKEQERQKQQDRVRRNRQEQQQQQLKQKKENRRKKKTRRRKKTSRRRKKKKEDNKKKREKKKEEKKKNLKKRWRF